MIGKSPTECLVLYQSAIDTLSRRFLERMLQEAKDPIHVLTIKKMIENIERDPSIQMELGEGQANCEIIFSKPPLDRR